MSELEKIGLDVKFIAQELFDAEIGDKFEVDNVYNTTEDNKIIHHIVLKKFCEIESLSYEIYLDEKKLEPVENIEG